MCETVFRRETRVDVASTVSSGLAPDGQSGRQTGMGRDTGYGATLPARHCSDRVCAHSARTVGRCERVSTRGALALNRVEERNGLSTTVVVKEYRCAMALICRSWERNNATDKIQVLVYSLC